MTSICMLVTSELDRDPRVQKEALIASRAGYDVTVICRTYEGVQLPYKILPLKIKRQKWRGAKYTERIYTNIALIRHVRQIKPKIVHANDLDTLPAAYIASRLIGARLVYDAHELWASAGRDVGSVGQKVMLAIEKFISSRADLVVAVSQLRANRMAELLGIPTPTVVMNTPLYTPFTSLTSHKWVQDFPDKRIVLHQGRYVSGRGIPEAVLAAKHLPNDVVLVFRGYGPIENELLALVEKYELEGKVVFVPPVPMQELVSYAVGADLGLVLYTPVNENNLYAAPNKMFEYMMAGVPSVSSDIPYAREILLDNEVGVVFKPGDPVDMAQVICDLLADTDRLAKMKDRCLHLASRFSWEVEMQKLLDQYEHILSAS